jgi:hypothetical protein
LAVAGVGADADDSVTAVRRLAGLEQDVDAVRWQTLAVEGKPESSLRQMISWSC